MSELAKSTMFRIDSMDALERMARFVSASGLWDKMTPEKAFVIIATGMELGISPLQAIRNIHIINGKPILSASLMVALCKTSPHCQYFSLKHSDNQSCTYETKRNGDPSPVSMTFSIQDAQRAGLMSREPWKNHTADMLRARCSSKLARESYPDVLMGIYNPDEAEDFSKEAEVVERSEVVATYATQQVEATNHKCGPWTKSIPMRCVGCGKVAREYEKTDQQVEVELEPAPKQLTYAQEDQPRTSDYSALIASYRDSIKKVQDLAACNEIGEALSKEAQPVRSAIKVEYKAKRDELIAVENRTIKINSYLEQIGKCETETGIKALGEVLKQETKEVQDAVFPRWKAKGTRLASSRSISPEDSKRRIEEANKKAQHHPPVEPNLTGEALEFERQIEACRYPSELQILTENLLAKDFEAPVKKVLSALLDKKEADLNKPPKQERPAF